MHLSLSLYIYISIYRYICICIYTFIYTQIYISHILTVVVDAQVGEDVWQELHLRAREHTQVDGHDLWGRAEHILA